MPLYTFSSHHQPEETEILTEVAGPICLWSAYSIQSYQVLVQENLM